MTFEEFVAEWIRQAREYGSRGIPQEAIDMAEEAWEQATKQLEERTRLLHAAFKMSRCECDSDEACRNLAALHRRVAELEAARGEPVAWMRRWHHDGETPKKSLNANGRMAWPFKFKLLPVTLTKALPDDVPLYTAPPAPAVDVDAISEEALVRGIHALPYRTPAYPNEMRAALRAIFNKGE